MSFRNRSVRLPGVIRGLLGDQAGQDARSLLIYIQPAAKVPAAKREAALTQLSRMIDRTPPTG